VQSLFVCLSVCLSVCQPPLAPLPVAQSRTPTAAFESLGLRYVLPTYPHGQLEGAGVELPVFFPADSVKFVSIVLSFVATFGE